MATESLAYTASTYDEMYQFIEYKLYYKINDESTTYETWQADAEANGSAAEQTAAPLYSGRAITIGIDMDFLPGWPSEPAFVPTWSGGCLQDYSSGAGGFCIFETTSGASMQSQMETGDGTAAAIYGISGSTAAIENWSDSERETTTFRLSSTQFASFATAWEDTAITDTTANLKDGRCWYNYLDGASLAVDSASLANVEYLDYAYCARSTNDWTCQLYLRNTDDQADGYPAFVTPGVVTGYWVASYLPGVEILSYSEVTDFIVYDNAMGVTAVAGAFVAGIMALMF